MASVNKAIVIGNIGRDGELRYTPGGQAVIGFSVATTETWNNKQGEKQESTEWHRIVIWGKQAETLAPYLTKGRQIYIEGSLTTRQWDKEGQKHYTTEIKAHKVQLLGAPTSRTSGEEVANRQTAADTYDPPVAQTDDDIPF